MIDLVHQHTNTHNTQHTQHSCLSTTTSVNKFCLKDEMRMTDGITTTTTTTTTAATITATTAASTADSLINTMQLVYSVQKKCSSSHFSMVMF